MGIVGFTILGALFFIQPASASPGDTVELSQFTDVQSVMTTVAKARTDATSLVQSAAKQSDKQHLQKAAQSFGDAIADSFTAANIEHFFNDVRQGVQELDVVQGPRAEAVRIESGVAEAIRAATLKFIESIDQGISRISDTRAREDARRRIVQAHEDYARGISAFSAGRFGEALDHWRHVFQKLIPVAAMIPASESVVTLESSIPLRTDFGKIRSAISAAGSLLQVYERAIVFPNGTLLDIPETSAVYIDDRTVVTAVNKADFSVDFRVFNMSGQLLFQRNNEGPGGMYLVGSGSIIVDDQNEGVGTSIRIYSNQGGLLSEIRPLGDTGFMNARISGDSAALWVFAEPEAVGATAAKLMVVSPSDGTILENHEILVSNVTNLVPGVANVVLVAPNRILVFNRGGTLIDESAGNPFQLSLDENSSRLLVATEDTLTRYDFVTGTPDWTVPLSGLYDRPVVVHPPGIIGPFRSYPFYLGAAHQGNVLVLLMAQSIFNDETPRYEGELVFLEAMTGRKLQSIFLGALNNVLRINQVGDVLYVTKDSTVEIYRVH